MRREKERERERERQTKKSGLSLIEKKICDGKKEKTHSSMSASPLLAMSTSFAPTLHSAMTALRAAVVDRSEGQEREGREKEMSA